MRRNLQVLSVEAQLLSALRTVTTVSLNYLHRSLQLESCVEKVPTL